MDNTHLTTLCPPPHPPPLHPPSPSLPPPRPRAPLTCRGCRTAPWVPDWTSATMVVTLKGKVCLKIHGNWVTRVAQPTWDLSDDIYVVFGVCRIFFKHNFISAAVKYFTIKTLYLGIYIAVSQCFAPLKLKYIGNTYNTMETTFY